MNVIERIKWLVGELLSNATASVAVLVVYDKEKGEARVFLSGKKVATISEEASVFSWALSNEQVARLYETCGEGCMRIGAGEKGADER